jgi:hypothetical protein
MPPRKTVLPWQAELQFFAMISRRAIPAEFSALNRWLCLEREAVPPKTKFQEVRLPNPASRWPVEVVSPQGWANDKAGASLPAEENWP